MIKKVEIHSLIDENTYFYIDDKTNHGFLIDPGGESDKLLKIINDNNYIIDKILITHAHFDHIGAANDIRNKLNIDVYAFSDKYLLSSKYNLSNLVGGFIIENPIIIKDGDVITLNNNKDFYLKVMHTPGHTEDSCIYYNDKEKIAFTGDTIFKSSIGNTGFPGGNDKELYNSIINKIFLLDENTKLYSGHSDVTTIKDEKKHNIIYSYYSDN